MLVNDLRGLVIPASFNKHHSRSIPGTGSASIIPLASISKHHSRSIPGTGSARIIHAGKGSQGLVIPASFSKHHSPGINQQVSIMPVNDLRGW